MINEENKLSQYKTKLPRMHKNNLNKSIKKIPNQK